LPKIQLCSLRPEIILAVVLRRLSQIAHHIPNHASDDAGLKEIGWRFEHALRFEEAFADFGVARADFFGDRDASLYK
jgi:hypothetical protein